jgi:predicted nucleic acid-binding protein
VKRYVIDTNALISFVTDRNPEQQRIVAPLFEAAAHMKAVILCHQNVLTEFIYVLDKVYQLPKHRIGQMIIDLVQMPGMQLVQELDYQAVLSVWPDPFPDFGDAVVASVALAKKGAAIVTFDRKFSLGLNRLNIPPISSSGCPPPKY